MVEDIRAREQKALRFADFCVRRLKYGQNEEEIAKGLGFGSPETLYHQLERDGSPVCGVCGLLYPNPDHRGEHKDKRRKRQPGVGGGHREKLPGASDARGLFREALRELDWYISLVGAEESCLEGSLGEEGFKGKHFITHTVDRDALEVARREEFTEAVWKELCKEHGVDPERDQLVLSRGEAAPGGVTRTPSGMLTALIAAYALAILPNTYRADHPLKPLVEALHHDPDAASWEKITDNIENLRKVAGKLATWVRGGIVESGTGITEVPREEHFVAWLIQASDREGAASDKDLLLQLKKIFPSIATNLTTKDIDRIRRERLESPK